jgi:hypothetical protein
MFSLGKLLTYLVINSNGEKVNGIYEYFSLLSLVYKDTYLLASIAHSKMK